MLRVLKAAWILFWAILLTLILFFPIVIAALVGKRGDAAFHGTQVYAWIILKVCGIRLRVRGKENIEPGQRYVILSNHASYFDPPALVLALGLQYRWVIKKELRRVPLFGLALETSRNLFIDRSKGSDALESIKRGVGQLPDGTSILIFPEVPVHGMANCCLSRKVVLLLPRTASFRSFRSPSVVLTSVYPRVLRRSAAVRLRSSSIPRWPPGLCLSMTL